MHVFVIIVTALLMLAGALFYAWHGDFLIITWTTLGVLATLTVVNQLLDYAASIIGARALGSGHWGIIGSCIGACAGFVVANVFGAVVGMFTGALYRVEYGSNESASAVGILAAVHTVFPKTPRPAGGMW